MQPFRLTVPLGLLLSLGSVLAQAAPGYGPEPGRHAPPPGAAMPGWQHVPLPGHAPHPTPRHQPAPPPAHRTHRHPAPPPPANFQPVRLQIHANRHHIGIGPALPPHVHIVRGKPLPPGWGKRLNAHQRRYVPHYHGYEWRRTGSDLVLVALATGIVHEILHEVLR